MNALNKNKSFTTHIGTLVNGIKYEQDGKSFDAAGKLIESKPKLAKPRAKSKPKVE